MRKVHRVTEDDRQKPRLARTPGKDSDQWVHQTAHALAAVRDALKPTHVDPIASVGAVWDRNQAPAIQADLRRSLIGPGVVAQPCPVCGAPAGAYCYPRCGGMCGARVHRALITMTLNSLEMSR